MPRFVPVAFVAFALAACGGPRLAGPGEDERGRVVYWLVTGSSAGSPDCSDKPDFKERIKAPVVEANSYVVYKVSADGKTAQNQNCTTTRASSCSDDPTIAFTVADHRLTFDPAPNRQVITDSACQLEGDELWTLTDAGETLETKIEIRFRLVGDALECQTLDEQLKIESPNGKGIIGCVVTLTIPAGFSHVDG